VENVSREVEEEDGAEYKNAHATTAVWAGFHNKNIWQQKVKAASWDGMESKNGLAWALCQRLGAPAAAENSSLLSLSVPPTDVPRGEDTSV
jgi:hypothetical protein